MFQANGILLEPQPRGFVPALGFLRQTVTGQVSHMREVLVVSQYSVDVHAALLSRIQSVPETFSIKLCIDDHFCHSWGRPWHRDTQVRASWRFFLDQFRHKVS
jgi:hypothetical protein